MLKYVGILGIIARKLIRIDSSLSKLADTQLLFLKMSLLDRGWDINTLNEATFTGGETKVLMPEDVDSEAILELETAYMTRFGHFPNNEWSLEELQRIMEEPEPNVPGFDS